tara:strand:- start:8058 stop:9104 length:1047 start_codon:yes stop_codon:yes gene_type:complete
MRFLVCVKSEYNAISYHRLKNPFKYLKKKGHQFDFINNFTDDVVIEGYDYFVYNRSIGYGDSDFVLLEKIKAQGIKIIIDVDDLWELPNHHPIVWRDDVDYGEWKNNFLMNIAFADYVWTSTEYLKMKIEDLFDNKPVVVVKNAIDYNDPQWVDSKGKRRNKNKTVIGYAGSTTHYGDLDQMKIPFRRLNNNKTFRRNMVFQLSGTDFVNDYAKKVWHHQLGIFTDDGKNKNVFISGGVKVNQYARFFDQMDIVIAPLIDNEFNRCKSELKVLEAGSKWLPFIGSDMITFSRTGANIDLCSNNDEWVESILELSFDKSLREMLGKELGEYVRDVYSIDKENQSRLSIL